MQIFRFNDSVQLLSQLKSGQLFDLFILDIVMPHVTGMELAYEIRKTNTSSKILFLTSSKEFAVDSYSVDAFHYILKPVQKDDFFSVLDRCCQEIDKQAKQGIIIKTNHTLTKILFQDLVHIEVIQRTISFYHESGLVLESNGTISDMETTLLKDSRFIKTHRSFIVNLDHVKKLSNEGLTMTTDHVVPISRNLFKKVKEKFIHHSFGVETT